MDPRIREIAERIVVVEGGLSDNPNDKGGITNHGVSLRYAKDIGLDLDGDHDTDSDDIRMVTPAVAVDLFINDFFEKPKFGSLPSSLHAQMFDMAVNHGPARPVMILQRVLNQISAMAPDVVPERLDEDGRIGGMTRKAAIAADTAMGAFLTNAVVWEREKFYRQIVENDASQAVFLNGWLKRARSFMVAVS